MPTPLLSANIFQATILYIHYMYFTLKVNNPKLTTVIIESLDIFQCKELVPSNSYTGCSVSRGKLTSNLA